MLKRYFHLPCIFIVNSIRICPNLVTVTNEFPSADKLEFLSSIDKLRVQGLKMSRM